MPQHPASTNRLPVSHAGLWSRATADVLTSFSCRGPASLARSYSPGCAGNIHAHLSAAVAFVASCSLTFQQMWTSNGPKTATTRRSALQTRGCFLGCSGHACGCWTRSGATLAGSQVRGTPATCPQECQHACQQNGNDASSFIVRGRPLHRASYLTHGMLRMPRFHCTQCICGQAHTAPSTRCRCD